MESFQVKEVEREENCVAYWDYPARTTTSARTALGVEDAARRTLCSAPFPRLRRLEWAGYSAGSISQMSPVVSAMAKAILPSATESPMRPGFLIPAIDSRAPWE